jgi:hypothetical protein
MNIAQINVFWSRVPGQNEEVSTMKIASIFILAIAVSTFQAGMAQAKSPADQALYERAVRECNSWKYYPNGASIHINYKNGWFRCNDNHDRKRR